MRSLTKVLTYMRRSPLLKRAKESWTIIVNEESMGFLLAESVPGNEASFFLLACYHCRV